MRAGSRFEDEIMARLRELHGDALVDVSGSTREDSCDLTARAMAGGSPVIVGARLADASSKRVGRPDLLVRVGGKMEPGAPSRYVPIDIKSHRCLEQSPPGDSPAPVALVSELECLWPEEAARRSGRSLRPNKSDALQLAHYQRLLEAIGAATEGPRLAGVIGREGLVVWYDLAAAIWTTPSSGGRRKKRTTLEAYDFEFDFRLDIAAVAMRADTDPSVGPLVVPVRISECQICPWQAYCREQMEIADDVSLLPHVGWRQRKVHLDHGVTTRAELAALDWLTARLVADGVDVASFMAEASGSERQKAAREVLPAARHRQASKLEAAGITSVADAERLCARTALYSSTRSSPRPVALPDQIDLARVALSREPVFRRRGVERLEVPRASIEIDIDMENNADNGVYLWGALVTDLSGRRLLSEGYHPAVCWAELSLEREEDLLVEFWGWLSRQRCRASAAGASVHVYCYSEPAEKSRLQKLAPTPSIRREVDELVASQQWVDMRKVFERQLLTGKGTGLKETASLAGFAWTSADAGGGQSMVRYEQAVRGRSDAARAEARRWLLRYNGDDVEATLALRNWMERAAPPSVAELGP